MRILLELSPEGVRVDQFLADALREQVGAARVLAELEPDLSVFRKAVRDAYGRARHPKRGPRVAPRDVPGSGSAA